MSFNLTGGSVSCHNGSEYPVCALRIVMMNVSVVSNVEVMMCQFETYS